MGIPMSITVAIGMHHREPLGTVGGEDLSVLPLGLALITTVFAAQAAFDKERPTIGTVSSPSLPLFLPFDLRVSNADFGDLRTGFGLLRREYRQYRQHRPRPQSKMRQK